MSYVVNTKTIKYFLTIASSCWTLRQSMAGNPFSRSNPLKYHVRIHWHKILSVTFNFLNKSAGCIVITEIRIGKSEKCSFKKPWIVALFIKREWDSRKCAMVIKVCRIERRATVEDYGLCWTVGRGLKRVLGSTTTTTVLYCCYQGRTGT